MTSPLLEEGSNPLPLESPLEGSSDDAPPGELRRTEITASVREERQALVLENLTPVWRFLRRLGLTNEDADDGAQEVFLTAVHKLDRIQPGQEKRYLFGIALRLASRRRRTVKTLGERNVSMDLDMYESATPKADEVMEKKETLEMLDEALSELSEEMRTVFVLYELEEMTMQEIAALVDIAPGTVASRLRRAREQFQKSTRRMQLTRMP